MASFNRVILIGNLTRDPEVKYLQSGTAVCDIGLAVNDKRKNAQGEWVDDVTFVDISLFGRTSEVAGEYCRKGSNLLIEGRLKLDTWEKDGQKRSKLKVIGDRLVMLGSKPQNRDSSESRQQSAPPPERQHCEPAPATAEDLPF